MRGLSEKEFSNSLKECFLSVWVDRESGFGTFPLESMATGVPVIGLLPDLPPTWIKENNGIWVDDLVLMSDFIADFAQNWLEDNIKPELYEEMKVTAQEYKNQEKFKTETIELFSNYINTRLEAFESQVSKIDE